MGGENPLEMGWRERVEAAEEHRVRECGGGTCGAEGLVGMWGMG